MIVTPVSSSPAIIERSAGAAPRQRGRSDGWTLSISKSESSGSLMSAPKAQTQTTSGATSAMRGSSLTLSGWCTSRPSSRARAATGGAVSLRPRPAGRSGRVTTSEGGGRRSSTAAANSLVPRKTVLTFAQPADRLLALVARGAIQDEHAVEVVDLVLDDPCLEPRGLDLDRLARLVPGGDADVQGALDVDDDAGEREAALLHDLLCLAAPLDHRVDERVDRALLLDAVDEQAMQRADLGGREADADRVDHQPPHPRDLLAQRLVEDLDGPRRRAQHGVAELADMAQRGLAARAFLLGQRRGWSGLLLDELLGLLVCHGTPRLLTAPWAMDGPTGRDKQASEEGPEGPTRHWGSTSTLNAAWRCCLSAATAVTAASTSATAAVRSAALTTTWERSRPRRRNSGAGPSAATARRSRTACAAWCAAPARSDEQTTRMSVENGG